MTTIYKTTERGGRRAICTLPLDAVSAALDTIKRTAVSMGWDFTCHTGRSEITIRFPKPDNQATYSVVRENSLPLQGD